ncbi:MAG: SGNH/GDSL hydrolase family protein [Sphingomonas sp.]|nr:MAG: SGNH/GDSL hydrolase family protein [Sphingomonas sp.]
MHKTGKPSGIPATRGVVVQAGDSIGAGLGADNWAAIDHLDLSRSIAIHNVSVSGQWMLTGLGQRETDLFPFYDKRYPSILLIQQGTNDLLGGNTAPYLYFNILKPFVSLSQAAGFYVAVDTILPRSDPGWMADREHEKHRIEYNTLVRANSIGADAVNDIAADPVIGDSSNPDSSPLYADGIHLRKPGQERLAIVNAKTLKRLLQYPPRDKLE